MSGGLGGLGKQATEIVVNARSQRGIISCLLAGAGMSYAVSREKYSQVPLAYIFPSAYAGYHLYKNRGYLHEQAKNHIREL